MPGNDAIALAFTGASGAQYGLRLLELLIKADRRVYLMWSKPAQLVIGMETDVKLPSRAACVREIGEPQDAKFFQLLGMFVSTANSSADGVRLDRVRCDSGLAVFEVEEDHARDSRRRAEP